ncbi:hypothetical protein ACSHWO_37410 (plasmid) [Streptomyces sp. HUAS TT3]|uniref:hypothetical protein n=1 Tax=Streptomyces sp. HUAS TT3 TaxID=3447510 RepID=UPI003F65F9B7
MRTRLGTTVAAVVLVVASLLGGATTATASVRGATGYNVIECPLSVWQGGDDLCMMAYTGSKWYTGDWVALHYTGGYKSAWANGYTPVNVDFNITVTSAGSWAFSPWKRGGTGVGASAGPVGVYSDPVWARLRYANGYELWLQGVG